jgi:DNA-binding CsgD family transcriptional regulator
MAAYPYFNTDFARCQEIAAQAGKAAVAAGDQFARDWAAILEGYSLQTRNRHDEAKAVSQPAFDRSRQRGDRFCAAFARGNGIFTTMLSGDVPAAVAIGREVLQIVAPLGDYFAVGTNTCNAAHAIAMSGGLNEARALMHPIITSLDKAPEADVVGFMVPYGLLHLWEGDLDGAIAWLQRGVQRMSGGKTDWTAVRCLPGLVGALRRLGRLDEAARYAARGVELASAFGAMYELTSLLDEQARMAAAQIDPALARDLLGQSLAIRRTYRLRMCYADALAALTAKTDPVEGVRLCAVADSAREAMGYPRPPVDRDEHEKLVTAMRADIGADGFAESYRSGAAADLDVAVAALTRGRGPRRRAHTGWDALTPTEVEVARLVARGLSNPQIAGRLYMSRSTVKAHLAHIYRKLSVANRTELATVVMEALPPG